MKKLFLLIIVGIFFVNFSTAEIDLGVVKQSDCISLYQSCPTCTYSNIRVITYPNGSVENLDISMTKNNSDFIYLFCNTGSLGDYSYIVYGNKGGLSYESSEKGFFEVTPSGKSGNENTVFFMFIIILIYGVTFISFYGGNIPMTILCGMAMLFLGIYLVTHGIIIFRDDITIYIAYLTIAIGGITSFWAILEQFDII